MNVRHKDFAALAFVLLLAGAFFVLTDPRRVPSVLLAVGFLLIFLTVWLCLRAVIHFLAIESALSRLARGQLTLGLALLMTSLLAMQSIGQLTVRDVVTVLALYGAGSFYVYRTRPSQ